MSSISRISPSWTRVGCKKTLCLLHYPRKIKFILSFILSLQMDLTLLSLSFRGFRVQVQNSCLDLHEDPSHSETKTQKTAPWFKCGLRIASAFPHSMRQSLFCSGVSFFFFSCYVCCLQETGLPVVCYRPGPHFPLLLTGRYNYMTQA